MFTLAHLSDPHLGPLPRPRLSELASKRIIGFLNWRRGRHLRHRLDVLNLVLDDIALAKPDHIAVTGDLVNIALTAEFAPAAAFLQGLGAPEHVSFVPGNHDVYVRASAHEHTTKFALYMGSDETDASAIKFPYIRRRGPIALIGLSTAIPTAPFMSTGKLGAAQRTRLSMCLDALAGEKLFRVVLIHHPPFSRPSERFKRLTDARLFREIIGQHGAELILHGHTHRRTLEWIATAQARVPVIGVPSASATLAQSGDPAGYNLIHVSGAPEKWRCEWVARGISEGVVPFVEVRREALIG